MSKLLRFLLEAEEPLFSQSLRELEIISSKPGVDIKLTAEIIEKTHATLRALGLDSHDTTDKELYYALCEKIRLHNDHLAKSLGVSSSASFRLIASKLIELIENSRTEKSCWVLKRSVAKELLRDMPPRILMKQLGYRSIESMFKNEDFAKIYVSLRFSEGEEWLRAFNQLFAGRVQPSDFESRKLEIVLLEHDKWSNLSRSYVKQRNYPVVYMKELGVVAVIEPAEKVIKGAPLLLLPSLIHYSNEVRLYSSYFKLRSTKADFGRIVSDVLEQDITAGPTIANFHIHWRVIQRHFGRQKTAPEFFQPHVQPEDLLWKKTEEMLSGIDSEFAFWQTMDYVASLGEDGLPVSFNLADMAINYSQHVPFKQRYYRRFRESLWNELFIRYMGEKTLKDQILTQLIATEISPEDLV